MSVYAYISQDGTLHVKSDDATSTFALKSFLGQPGQLNLRVLDSEFKLREPAQDEQASTQYPTPTQGPNAAPTPVPGPRSGINDGVAQEDEVVRGLRSRINDLIRDNTQLRERGVRLARDCLILQGEIQDANRRGAEAQQRVKELERDVLILTGKLQDANRRGTEAQQRIKEQAERIEELKVQPGPEVDYKYLAEITELGLKVGDRELIDGDELKLGRGLALVYKETRNGHAQPSHAFSAAPSAIQSGEGMIQYWLGEEKLSRAQALKRIASAGFNDSFKLGAYRELAASTILKLRQHSERLKVIQQTLRDDSTQRLHKVVREQTAGVRFNDE